MTSPTTGSRGDSPAEHIDIEELADAAEGLVDDQRAQVIDAHLAVCAGCAADADALAEAQQSLGSAPTATMPADVFARLQSVIADEQHLRATDAGDGPTGTPGAATADAAVRYDKQSYTPDSQDLADRVATPASKPPLAERYSDLTGPQPTQRAIRAKFAGGALAATLLAGTAGFGGYVASAAAGTDEPPAHSPVVVSTDGFAQVVGRLWRGDLDPYRFTQAWSCARKVTDGRITGIKVGVLSGQPGFLVFLQQQDQSSAVFVTGCDTPTPLAGPSADLPDR